MDIDSKNVAQIAEMLSQYHTIHNRIVEQPEGAALTISRKNNGVTENVSHISPSELRTVYINRLRILHSELSENGIQIDCDFEALSSMPFKSAIKVEEPCASTEEEVANEDA